MANSNGWGDGAANNSIGWGQGANNSIGWGSSHATSYAGLTDIVGLTTDTDAQAFITAAGITDATQQSAIDTLVKSLKSYNIWTKMKAIYPFVGGTATTHKYNLKDPRDLDAAFRLVFNGGWTHSSTGATPNGTNGYADTKLNSLNNLTNFNHHFSFYSRSSTTANTTVEMGCTSVGPSNFAHLRTAVNYVGGGLSVVSFTTTNTSQGFWIGTTRANNDKEVYRNGISEATLTTAISTTLPNLNVYIGARNDDNTSSVFSDKQCAFSTIGDGLSDTEASNLYTAVQAFQTSLGRSIGTQTVSDADAQAFVTAANIQDQVQATAINNLVIGLKSDGLWSKMKAIYPFVGGTATTHKYNLKDPQDTDAAFRLVFNGGWTHDSNGATPNGTNGYADTKLNALSVLTNNNYHLSHYSRTQNSATSSIEIGALSIEATSLLALDQYYAGVNAKAFAAGGYPLYTATINNTDTLGYIIGSRASASSAKIYMDGTYLAQNTTTNLGALPNRNLYMSSNNNAGTGTATEYSNKQTAFASIGDGLTDTEAANLYNRVQNYQIALSRNV